MIRSVIVGLTLTAAAGFGSLAGCGKQNQFAPPPPPQVTVAQPVEQPVDDAFEFTGWTQATASVTLRSRVNGYLEKVNFKDGAVVHQGDLLFVIEQAPYQAALDAAKADAQKADASRQLANTEYQRALSLVQRQTIPQAELDIKAAELATATANVAAAAAALRQAELNMAYTEIRAPLTGRIGQHMVDPGNLVQGGQTELAMIESYDPIYAYFSVSEEDVLKFMKLSRDSGATVEEMEKNPPRLFLGLSNETDYPREGYFDFSERSLDRQTGTALRRGVFPNPDQSLVPGLFVRIRAPIGEPKPKLVVEERAVSADQRGDYLLVVNDKKVVEYRPVKLGTGSRGMRVVEEGIKPGDWVVVNGLQRARPGVEVNPQQAQMGVAQGAPGGGAPAAASSAEAPAKPGAKRAG